MGESCRLIAAHQFRSVSFKNLFSKIEINIGEICRRFPRGFYASCLLYLAVTVSSFLLQDYISSILWLVFSCWVCLPVALSPSSIIYIIIGLLISGISSCLTSINFYMTILNMRSYYKSLAFTDLLLCGDLSEALSWRQQPTSLSRFQDFFLTFRHGLNSGFISWFSRYMFLFHLVVGLLLLGLSSRSCSFLHRFISFHII